MLTALAGEGDVLILDRLCHASLIDAARLSKADFRVYPHLDLDRLEGLLRKHADARRRFVVTEGVFSMDGDVAPLGEIARLAERHGAWLILDDAHALGVLGKTGRGTCEYLDVTLGERTVIIGTLSKALGTQGGFAAAASEVMDVLVNRARTFIYTTGLSPMCASAALCALELVADGTRRRHLLKLSRTAREALTRVFPDVPRGVTPIIPVIVGDVTETVKLSSRLFDSGVFAPAIRPPTVAPGTARLRISLSADHTQADVERLTEALLPSGRR